MVVVYGLSSGSSCPQVVHNGIMTRGGGSWRGGSSSSSWSLRSCCPPWASRSPACFAPMRTGIRTRTRNLGVVLVQCKAPALTENEFEKEVLQSEAPVLVDFWAEWCGPCKLVAPIMDSLAKEYQGTLKVYKIETDSNPSLVEKYKVYGLPTLILFKDGKEVPGGRKEGAINKKKLKLLLDELLGTVSTV